MTLRLNYARVIWWRIRKRTQRSEKRRTPKLYGLYISFNSQHHEKQKCFQ